MKALILFTLVALISCNGEVYFDATILKCAEDKIKIGEDVCVISQDVEDGRKTYTISYIKKKCGKNQGCSATNFDKYDRKSGTYYSIYTCQLRFKLLNIGKKCNYNAECYSGFCKNGKCAAYDDGTCNTDENCEPDKYCDYVTEKCVDYIKEGEDCSGSFSLCQPGFLCDDYGTKTCKKYYSLGTGDDCYIDYQCKSNICYNDKCVEIESVDDKCLVTFNDGTNKKIVSNQTTTANNGELTCNYAMGYKDLIANLIKRYNKVKLNKILENRNCGYSDDLCDKKYSQLNYVNFFYPLLLHQGIIKENGERNKDKKCEYDFWISTISSSYINVCFEFVFVLLSLLF